MKNKAIQKPGKRLMSLSLLALFLLGGQALAQVTIKKEAPKPLELTIEDCVSATITAPKTITVYVVSTATEVREGRIARVTTELFEIKLGINHFDAAHLPPIEETWIASKYERLIRQTGKFPEGNYTILIQLFTEEGELLDEDKRSQEVRHPQIRLISPEDGVEVTDLNPNFLWSITRPTPGVEYKLSIYEVMPGQTPQEATEAGIPYFERAGIKTTSSRYPVGARTFESGNYCWQVQGNIEEYSIAISPTKEFLFSHKKPVEHDLKLLKRRILEKLENVEGVDEGELKKLKGKIEWLLKKEKAFKDTVKKRKEELGRAIDSLYEKTKSEALKKAKGFLQDIPEREQEPVTGELLKGKVIDSLEEVREAIDKEIKEKLRDRWKEELQERKRELDNRKRELESKKDSLESIPRRERTEEQRKELSKIEKELKRLKVPLEKLKEKLDDIKKLEQYKTELDTLMKRLERFIEEEFTLWKEIVEKKKDALKEVNELLAKKLKDKELGNIKDKLKILIEEELPKEKDLGDKKEDIKRELGRCVNLLDRVKKNHLGIGKTYLLGALNDSKNKEKNILRNRRISDTLRDSLDSSIGKKDTLIKRIKLRNDTLSEIINELKNDTSQIKKLKSLEKSKKRDTTRITTLKVAILNSVRTLKSRLNSLDDQLERDADSLKELIRKEERLLDVATGKVKSTLGKAIAKLRLALRYLETGREKIARVRRELKRIEKKLEHLKKMESIRWQYEVLKREG